MATEPGADEPIVRPAIEIKAALVELVTRCGCSIYLPSAPLPPPREIMRPLREREGAMIVGPGNGKAPQAPENRRFLYVTTIRIDQLKLVIHQYRED